MTDPHRKHCPDKVWDWIIAPMLVAIGIAILIAAMLFPVADLSS